MTTKPARELSFGDTVFLGSRRIPRIVDSVREGKQGIEVFLYVDWGRRPCLIFAADQLVELANAQESPER